MEWDGKVGPPRAQCALSGRALAPGEQAYGVLVRQAGAFQRLDIAAECWPQYDRSQALSWWRRSVPAAAPRRAPPRLDPAALERIVADLEGREDAECQALRYLAALALARLRRLAFVGSGMEDGVRVVRFSTRDGRVLTLREPDLSGADEARLSAQLLAVAEAGDASPAGEA